MFYYAQIDVSNTVIGISQLAGQVVDASYITIQSYDESLLGKIWNGTTFNAPPPPVVVPPARQSISKLDFLNLFTDAELTNILTAAKSNTAVELFVKKLDIAGEVHQDHQLTIATTNSLEQAGLIGVGRAAQILAGTPHP